MLCLACALLAARCSLLAARCTLRTIFYVLSSHRPASRLLAPWKSEPVSRVQCRVFVFNGRIAERN
jgi:hypothetical protein